MYRLGQLFDFFRMLSFYFTTVGYYVCTMVCQFLLSVLSLKTILNQVANILVYLTRNVSLIQMTVLTVYVFLYGRAYLVIYQTSFMLSWFDQLLVCKFILFNLNLNLNYFNRVVRNYNLFKKGSIVSASSETFWLFQMALYDQLRAW